MQDNILFNKGVSIVRELSGGSNATTVLCMDNDKTFYRKYAFEADADKLEEQIKWIEENKGRISTPKIIGHVKNNEYCYYDMAYSIHSVDLFEYAHSMPIDNTWNIIKSVFQRMEKSIYSVFSGKSNPQLVAKYCKDKIQKNMYKILNSQVLSNVMLYDTIVINGVEYNNLKHYVDVLFGDKLIEVFMSDNSSIIHGDLTMENIIIQYDEHGAEDFYIIDPNTGNIHNSKNIDYAKILQSLHGEYEFIKTAKDIVVSGNSINYSYTHSSVYAELYKRYRNYLEHEFDIHTIRSIYFHEIVNWLRLMPYKLQNDKVKAPAYYAKTIMILNDVMNTFGN